MDKRTFLATCSAAALLAACSTTSSSSGNDPASKRRTIDAEADGAMTKLYAQVPGSRELVGRARGVLVFPAIVSAGFVVGASHGDGALRVGGTTDGYYSTTSGSVGLLAGAESKAMYILFMTDDALAKFKASKGWTAGADASVTMLKSGAQASLDTMSTQQPVVAYVLSNAGLMANLSVDGTKISKLEI